MGENILEQVIRDVECAQSAWCRFITGNDTGATGSHQAGFYIPKCAAPLLFASPCHKGENREKTVQITWQNGFTTESRMKYYGRGTRNEYRITRFGTDFPFLQDENVGDLLIICKHSEQDYKGFVLSRDRDVDAFFACFNLAPGKTNWLISAETHCEPTVEQRIIDAAARLGSFVDTRMMSETARNCYNEAHHVQPMDLCSHPDTLVLEWINTEFRLFQAVEEQVYADAVSTPMGTISRFVALANELLNRRKSRAGKSLEHHLASIFHGNHLAFEEQVVTEGRNTADFLFPDGEHYHNFAFPTEGLTMLGAKTTCKDRWRQVLTEANRLEHKYLFTLQQGVSISQLNEMHAQRLTLVVPRPHLSCFPAERFAEDVIDLSTFIHQVKAQQVQYT